MHRVVSTVAVALAIGADLIAASPTTTLHKGASKVVAEPCAQVSKAWAAAQKTGTTATVSASLAYDCLNSAPLDKAKALQFVDSIAPYLEWQSDSAYKADPPKDYSFPGYDMFAGLAAVKTKLQQDNYKNEYTFQVDLYKSVFAPGHDGHMAFYPDLLTRATRFGRKHALVSISPNGQSLPVIKIYQDVISSPKTASTVTKINGMPAFDYLSGDVNSYSGGQDFDGGYNSMFYQKAIDVINDASGDFKSGGRGGFIYHGANTTYTFENGTVSTVENIAYIRGDMTDVVDGQSFYDKFCKPVDPTSDDSTPDATVNGAIPGYPKPVIMTSDGIVSGYYLTGKGFEHVAVIALLAFESKSAAEFQNVVRKFIAKAKKDGKTKLVVDFQANGGGYVLLGYDFFRQLFPQIIEDGNSRWRANNGFLGIANTFSEEVTNTKGHKATSAEQDDADSSFPYQSDLNITNQAFLSFDDKFAAHTYKNTRYTNIMRYNWTGSGLTGYGYNPNLTQTFAAEDIVLVYDGYCASTCTIASEMLRIQGGVKSIAFGGRPVAGPMQGVGGVKGSQILGFEDINRYVQRAAALTTDKDRQTEFARYNRLAFQRASAAAVNVRDQILRGNVEDGLPAQYVNEPADCRLYWTAPMLTDVTKIWEASASAAFFNGTCANGGITAGAHRRSAPADEQAPEQQDEDEVIPSTLEARPDDADWLAIHRQKVVL